MQVYELMQSLELSRIFPLSTWLFWALRSLRIENLFKAFKETQVRLAILMLAIAIGFTCSTFS